MACFLSESVLKYITVRRMSDTNASEKTDEKYKEQLEKSGAKYKILSEKTNEDGSIVIEIKKQYNTSPVGEYLN